MRNKLAAIAVVLTAGAMSIGGHTPSAQAEPPPVLGGGSGIVVNGQALCTLTTIGHDAGGRLVGFTAGHCGDVGTSVRAGASRDADVVGSVAYANTTIDYAVIVFDPGKVVPVNRVGNTTIAALGSPPMFPDISCKNGRSTGETCGLTYGDILQSGGLTWSQMCVAEGDSGAPVVVGTTLVGMVRAYLGFPCIGPAVGTTMSAIIDDVNQRGGTGSGYVPI